MFDELFDLDRHEVLISELPFAIPLNVPFADNEDIKALGGTWNSKEKCWYARTGTQIVDMSFWSKHKVFSKKYYIVESVQECLSCKTKGKVYGIVIFSGFYIHMQCEYAGIINIPYFIRQLKDCHQPNRNDLSIYGDIFRYGFDKRYGNFFMNHCQNCGEYHPEAHMHGSVDAAFFPAHEDCHMKIIKSFSNLAASAWLAEIDPRITGLMLRSLSNNDNHLISFPD